MPLHFVDSGVRTCRMPVDIPWPHPEEVGLRSSLWRWTSNVTILTFGSLSKLWVQGLNTACLYNEKTLFDLVEEREEGRSLLTVSNHSSMAGEDF